MVRWLKDNGCAWSEEACEIAAKKGDLTMLQWLRRQGCPWNVSTLHAMAAEGHLEMLQWLKNYDRKERDSPLWPRDYEGKVQLFCLLARCGRIELLSWAREAGLPFHRRVCESASKNDVVKWLIVHGCPVDEQGMLKNFARSGDIEMMKWLTQETEMQPRDMDIFNAAAARGDIAMLQWLWEQGCVWGADTCCVASASGQLEALKWLRERGCPWNEETGKRAAEEGRIEVLKWARENGCSWDDGSTVAAAVAKQREDVVQWLVENGFGRERKRRNSLLSCGLETSNGNVHCVAGSNVDAL